MRKRNTFPGTLINVQGHFLLSPGGGRGSDGRVLLASRGQMPEVVLNILQCTGEDLGKQVSSSMCQECQKVERILPSLNFLESFRSL